ncbi:MAG: alkaline phosphatase family protein [Opitutales bacterium]|nr:alkaline phosphatase family protein [Opitutales bacterium]MCH8539783.1 alkaline phosphatase family protein [Opitutales bacterium]
MNIKIENSVLCLTAGNKLDQNAGIALHQAIFHKLPEDVDKVEIDLAEVDSVNAAGIDMLFAIQRKIREYHAALHLINPNPAVRQMLSLTQAEGPLTVKFREPKKKAILPLFVFVDACGWEIIKKDPFAGNVAPHRRKLRSVFGYSSACIPSILSGRWPEDTRNWCYFVRDPENSPFRSLKILKWLPKMVTSRRRFRRYLSKLMRRPLKFRGYFDLYNIPFRHISLFDFTEKKSPLEPQGLNRGPNIFDHFEERGIPYHVSVPTRTEHESLRALQDDISAKKIDFAFLYWPSLDGLMHETGNQSPRISEKLREYEGWLNELLATANHHYEEVRLYVFSDHGMANCDNLLDLRAILNKLPLEMPRDYTVVYDSTMARFWFETEEARKRIVEALGTVDQGRIIEDAELKELRTFFPDRYFGELIFLVKESVLIIPSDMGERPLRGMHGYHPDDPHSYASLLTNVAGLSEKVTDIPHVYQLMVDNAEYAHIVNNEEELVPEEPQPVPG